MILTLTIDFKIVHSTLKDKRVCLLDKINILSALCPLMLQAGSGVWYKIIILIGVGHMTWHLVSQNVKLKHLAYCKVSTL